VADELRGGLLPLLCCHGGQRITDETCGLPPGPPTIKLPASLLADRRRFDVIFPVRLQESEDGRAFDTLGTRFGPHGACSRSWSRRAVVKT
jgi:hypothetical protein